MAREGSRKVRTGCLTCKARKVKCDETKPACLRCVKLDRPCEGYSYSTTLARRTSSQRESVDSSSSSLCSLGRNTNQRIQDHRTATRILLPKGPYAASSCSSSSSAWLRPQAPPSVLPLSSRQALYLDVYRYKVAPRFPDHEFWRRIVQREASSDTSVRDSIVALGAMCLALEREQGLYRVNKETRASTAQALLSCSPSDSGFDSPGGHSTSIVHDVTSPFQERDGTVSRQSSQTIDDIVSTNLCEAGRHHARAMSAFRTRLAQEGTAVSARSIFIATYLFVVFEQIQGNTAEADRLLILGVSLLRRHLAVLRIPKTGWSLNRKLSHSEAGQSGAGMAIQASTTESALAAKMDDGGLREAERCFVHMAAVYPAGHRIRDGGVGGIGDDLASQVCEARVPDLDEPVDRVLVEWDLFVSRSGLWMFRLAPSASDTFPAGNIEPQREDGATLDEASSAEKARQVCQVILTKYTLWRTLFEHKLATETDAQCRAALGAATVCQMMSFMCFSCLSDASEMAWDAFIPDCRTAVAALEEEMRHDRAGQNDGETDRQLDSPVTQHYESLRFPVLHPLYFIAQKCREWSTRKRALAMLRRLAEKEESWHVKLLVAGCEAHAAAEERGRDGKTGEIASAARFAWTSYAWTAERTKMLVTLPPARNVGVVSSVSGNQRKPQVLCVRPDEVANGMAQWCD